MLRRFGKRLGPRSGECFFNGRAFPRSWSSTWSYNPLETLLLRKAKSQGAECVNGLEMFIEQAVQQFEIFTGESAPRAVMERAALEALTQMHEQNHAKTANSAVR